jgi:hypothetical protein
LTSRWSSIHEADALEHRVSAEAAGQLADTLDGLLTTLADDIRRAELLAESDSVGMMAEEDDLLGAETSGGDDTAQADGAVADNGDALATPDLRAEGRVVAGRHHVRQGEKGRHQRVVSVDREDDERAVRLGDADGFALAAVDAVIPVPASVEARGVQSLSAEDAGPVGPQKRRHDEVAGFERADLGTDVLDQADELVPHAAARFAVLHRLVGPEIAAADGGAGDRDQRVCGLDEAGVRDVVDADVACSVHHSRTHRQTFFPDGRKSVLIDPHPRSAAPLRTPPR